MQDERILYVFKQSLKGHPNRPPPCRMNIKRCHQNRWWQEKLLCLNLSKTSHVYAPPKAIRSLSESQKSVEWIMENPLSNAKGFLGLAVFTWDTCIGPYRTSLSQAPPPSVEPIARGCPFFKWSDSSKGKGPTLPKERVGSNHFSGPISAPENQRGNWGRWWFISVEVRPYFSGL